MFHQLRSLLAVLMLGACAPGATTHQVSRPTSPTVTPKAPSTAGPWSMRPTFALQQVLVSTQAVVAITGDPAMRVDTLQATLGASYALVPGSSRRHDGQLTSYQVASGAGLPASPAGLGLPARFSVEIGGAGAGFRLPAESSVCSGPALSVMQGLYDAWTVLPETLGLRTEWTDTVHAISCRDRLPLKGTSTRHFRVVRADVENGRVVVTVERRARSRLAGDGEQFGEPVTIEGQGESLVHYVLDVEATRWIRARGTSTLDLMLKSRRRNQRVKQETRIVLVWNP